MIQKYIFCGVIKFYSLLMSNKISIQCTTPHTVEITPYMISYRIWHSIHVAKSRSEFDSIYLSKVLPQCFSSYFTLSLSNLFTSKHFCLKFYFSDKFIFQFRFVWIRFLVCFQFQFLYFSHICNRYFCKFLLAKITLNMFYNNHLSIV